MDLELPLGHVLLHPVEEGEDTVRVGQPLVRRCLGEVGARHPKGVGHPLQRRDGVLVCGVVASIDDPDPAEKGAPY